MQTSKDTSSSNNHSTDHETQTVQSAQASQSIFTPTLITFLTAMILANIASRMEKPLLPLYLQSLGAQVEQVGLFFTVTSMVPLMFQILGGFVSDSIGRLRAIAIGSTAGCIGYMLFIFAPSWRWLLLAQGLSSISSCFVAPSFRAFIAEQSSAESRGRVYGTIDAIYMIVGVIGPPLGGFISQNYGFRTMFVAVGTLFFAATVIRLAMARRDRRETGSRADQLTVDALKQNLGGMTALILGGGVMTWLFISDGVTDIAFGMSDQLQPLYLSNIAGLTNTQIGMLTSIKSIAIMAMIAFGGYLSDTIGERFGIVVGHAVTAAGIGVFLLSKTFWHFAVAWFLFGAGHALYKPAYDALVSKVVPLSLRGTAFGLFSTSLGLISLPAPFIGSVVWHNVGPRAPFLIPLIAGIIMTPIMWAKLAPASSIAVRNGDDHEMIDGPEA